MFGRHDLYLIVSAAVLLFLSLPPFSFWPLAFLALAPFIFFLSQNGFSRKAFLGSYFFGFIFLLLQYSFVFNILPLDWVGITSGTIGVGLALFFWLSLSAVLAFSFIFFPFIFYPVRDCLVLHKFSNGVHSRIRAVSPYLPYFLFPLFWPASEMLRSFLYSILTLGPGSTVGNHFAFGYLSYTAVDSPFLLFLSPYLGFYGLSFVFAFSASAIVLFWKKFPDQKYISLFIFLFFLLLYVVPIGAKNFASQKVNILSIQANNPVVFGYDEAYFKKAAKTFTQSITDGLALNPNTDIVLLSENSGFFNAYAKAQNLSPEEAIKKLLGRDKKRFLVYGAYDEALVRETTRVISNQGAFTLWNRPKASPVETRQDEGPVVYSTGDSTGFSEKSLTKEVLMPIGEYQPYVLGFLARITGQGDWFRNLSSRRGAAALTDAKIEKYFETPFGRVAVLACSEILSQKAYGLVKEAKPVLILHQQRLAPFHEGKIIFKHFLAASRLRAAMLRTPIAGSLDGGGFSYIIDSTGQIVSLGTATSTFIYAEIAIAN
jgi:apolipoprotein N-acyltransferase